MEFQITNLLLSTPKQMDKLRSPTKRFYSPSKPGLKNQKGLWTEKLPSFLWAYRTKPQATTGETPFSLTYGFEAIVLTELEQPTYRVTTYNEQNNEEAFKGELNLVEEKKGTDVSTNDDLQAESFAVLQ